MQLLPLTYRPDLTPRHQIGRAPMIMSSHSNSLNISYRVPSSSSYRFWIAAVNAASRYSSPVTLMADMTITPSNVTGFTFNQRATDRSIIDLSWAAVTDVDLAHYELRLGDTWASGQVINITKALGSSYQLKVDDYYRFWIAAVNASGNVSANPATITVTAVITPSDVTRFTVSQKATDRSILLLTWAAVTNIS